MRVYAPQGNWTGSYAEVTSLTHNIQNIDGNIVCITRSEHRFLCINGGPDKTFPVEYNHTIYFWDTGLETPNWVELYRDAVEPHITVNEDEEYNHVDCQNEHHVNNIREMQFFMEDGVRYKVGAYTGNKMPGANTQASRDYELPPS